MATKPILFTVDDDPEVSRAVERDLRQKYGCRPQGWTILGYKLKSGVSMTREYDRSLPRISAYGSELNQVWTNLLDNAIAAMGRSAYAQHKRDSMCV